MEKSSNSAKKVLFIAPSGIGNLLMQSPTIEALKKAHPNWHTTAWVAPRGTKAIADANPYIDQVIEAPVKGGLAHHLAMIKELKNHNYDVGIILYPGQPIKNALYLKAASIPQRIGHAYPMFGRTTGLFLTDVITENKSLHDIEQNLALLKPLRISTPNNPEYNLHIPASTYKKAEEVFAQLAIPASKKLIGIHPGSAAGFEWKRWPTQHWIKLGKYLIDKNMHILILGGPQEEEIKNTIHKHLGSSSTVITQPLLITAAIIKRCHQVIANDSGLMHTAAALKVPTIGLFGPTDETNKGPRGQHAHILRAPNTTPVYETERGHTDTSLTAKSLEEITPEIVLQYIR